MNICSIISFYILLIFFNSTVTKASPLVIDKIAVIINNNIILKSDIDSIVNFINMENISIREKFKHRNRLVEEIILKNILFEIGKKKNLSVAENQIYQSMALHIKNMADRRHLPLYQFYHDFFSKWKYHLLYEQILQNIIINSVIKNNVKNSVTITPYEITQQLNKPNFISGNSYYYNHPKIFITEMHVRHILITRSPLMNDKEILKKLNKIYLDIKNRKINFYTAAKKYSQDSTSVFQGGDLGWITPDMLGEPLGFVLLNLNKNDISPPVWADNSWHIIQLQETHKKNKTDVILKEQALQMLYQRKWNIEIQKWIKKKSKDAYVNILDTQYTFHSNYQY
ncbi:MAG: peptidylprolyl isomerase [Candidatus Dasytiphilus stammeri]